MSGINDGWREAAIERVFRAMDEQYDELVSAQAETDALQGECVCLEQDRDEARAALVRSREERDAAVGLLRYMEYEDAPCRLDHHGYCRDHPGGFREVDGRPECWIAAIRAFLASIEQAPAAEPR